MPPQQPGRLGASSKARDLSLKRREEAKKLRLLNRGQNTPGDKTYAERRKESAFGSQEEASPFTLHAAAIKNDGDNPINTFPLFQAPPIRVIDKRNQLCREYKHLITVPGITREVQQIDEADTVKDQLREQMVPSAATGTKGRPFWERKEKLVKGNGGTLMIPPHVARIRCPSSVIRKLVREKYQKTRYGFAPNTAVLVKRFEDYPCGSPIGDNWVDPPSKRPMTAGEMVSADMQKMFSHYYRSGSLYVRHTDKAMDGNRMLQLRVMARKKADQKKRLEQEMEKMGRRKKNKDKKKQKLHAKISERSSTRSDGTQASSRRSSRSKSSRSSKNRPSTAATSLTSTEMTYEMFRRGRRPATASGGIVHGLPGVTPKNEAREDNQQRPATASGSLPGVIIPLITTADGGFLFHGETTTASGELEIGSAKQEQAGLAINGAQKSIVKRPTTAT